MLQEDRVCLCASAENIVNRMRPDVLGKTGIGRRKNGGHYGERIKSSSVASRTGINA
jgi:hypothetical protein